mgnify:CR=1 FL=1
MDDNRFTTGVQKDLARRKQELSRMTIMVGEENPDPTRLSYICRSAVMLVYAHWEGFVKTSSIKYIKFVSSQQVSVANLKLPLQAAYLVSHFKRASESTKPRHLGELLGEIDGRRGAVFSVNPNKCIDTESNLSSTVFRDLVLGLGLDYLDFYSTRQNFIDQQVLHSRNQVAHGELVTFDSEEVKARISGVRSLLDTYSNQLINAVRDQDFLAVKG